ncbi:MAG: hypothetical protein R2761_18580 [Acidimicrobiales bacterium]
MKKLTRAAVMGVGAIGLTIGGVAAADASIPKHRFEMVRTAGLAATCAPEATATVTIRSLGPVEVMSVDARGLPADTEFDLFVTQVPNAPFGLSWYQGDLETNYKGKAHGTFVGRFSQETFSVAVKGGVPAPVVHDGSDAASNPATAPVHQFHLGLWFNSPEDAEAAGCPAIVTPFNGEHDAGIQILNTGTFPDGAGPLGEIG